MGVFHIQILQKNSGPLFEDSKSTNLHELNTRIRNAFNQVIVRMRHTGCPESHLTKVNSLFSSFFSINKADFLMVGRDVHQVYIHQEKVQKYCSKVSS